MKRILIVIIFVLGTINSNAQLFYGYSTMINGYWGNLKSAFSEDTYYYNKPKIFHYSLGGYYNDLILHRKEEHPSNYIMKLTLFQASEIFDNKNKNMDKVRKNAYKNEKWHSFQGEIEFYSSGPLLNFVNDFPYSPHARSGKGVMKKEPVTVLVLGFKNYPKQYQIIFNNDRSLGIHFLLK